MVDPYNPVAQDNAPSPLMERIYELYMAACAHDPIAAAIIMMPHDSGINVPYSIEEFAIAWEDPEFTFVLMDLLDCRSKDLMNEVIDAIKSDRVNESIKRLNRTNVILDRVQDLNNKISLLAGIVIVSVLIHIVVTIFK
jgi:hypothetical protein